MAFKLTKAEEGDIAAKLATLIAERKVLDDSIEAYNAIVRAAWEKVEGDLATYQEAKFALGGTFRDLFDIHEAAFIEKSDRWQEGERGQATEEWFKRFEEYADELESELPITQPEEIDINDETDFETYLEDIVAEPY